MFLQHWSLKMHHGLPSLAHSALLAALLHWSGCYGYSTGAPDTACNSMTPRHDFSRSSTATSPFVVLVSQNTYEPGESIMVMLRGLCSNKFKGFLVEARRADPRTNTTERIGTFTEVQESRYACGHETSLTHVTNIQKTSLLFNWTAPATPSGHVIIKATFVQEKSKFWVGVNSAVVIDPRASVLSIPASNLVTPYITPCAEDLPQTTTHSPPTVPTSAMIATTTTTQRTMGSLSVITSDYNISTSFSVTPVQPPRNTLGPTTPSTISQIHRDPQCGITQGCFSDCPKRACRFEIAWKDIGDRVWFSVRAIAIPDSPEQWVAVGFSKDTKMGDDSVVECVRTQERTVISASYNDHRMNTRIRTTIPVANLAYDSLNNGFIQCEFTRLKKLDGESKVFDLNNNYYILLAQGLSNNRGFMEKHIRLPTVSEKMVNFKSLEVVSPDFMDQLFIKIHACVMTFAWMFCASIGIVVSRFYKPLWPQKRFCGRKAWFTIHRLLMLFLGFLVTGAFILIFVEVQGMSDISFVDFRNMHPILGIIIMGLTTIQVLLGLCRPTSTSKNRPVFNWAHWCVGIISHILAVGNIILGVNLKKARVHEYVAYVLYCFAVYQVFIVLVLEVVACNSRIKERKQQTYSIYATRNTTYSSTKDGDDNSEEPPGSFVRRVILRIHVLVVTAFTGSVVAIIAVS